MRGRGVEADRVHGAEPGGGLGGGPEQGAQLRVLQQHPRSPVGGVAREGQGDGAEDADRDDRRRGRAGMPARLSSKPENPPVETAARVWTTETKRSPWAVQTSSSPQRVSRR